MTLPSLPIQALPQDTEDNEFSLLRFLGSTVQTIYTQQNNGQSLPSLASFPDAQTAVQFATNLADTIINLPFSFDPAPQVLQRLGVSVANNFLYTPNEAAFTAPFIVPAELSPGAQDFLNNNDYGRAVMALLGDPRDPLITSRRDVFEFTLDILMSMAVQNILEGGGLTLPTYAQVGIPPNAVFYFP